MSTVVVTLFVISLLLVGVVWKSGTRDFAATLALIAGLICGSTGMALVMSWST